jgi:hypothetical protein
MGRPLPKKFFGANSNNNIKVQFHNGTESVRGYILEQTGSKRFTCIDENGTSAVCYLVAKASADLAAGEMSISFVYDDGTVQQATKIARHKATFSYNGEVRSMPWDFSTSDGVWQIEEAGTDEAMTDATDLEEDDVTVNEDYPVPGSGTYKTAATALSGITYADKGTPYDPGGEVDSVFNEVEGLARVKFFGNFTETSSSIPSTWDYTFFDTAEFIKYTPDTYVSWGQQIDGEGAGESLFSIQWIGYVQVPTTQNYNFYAESDDHIAMWIGTAAEDAPANNSRLLGSSNKSLPSDAATAGVANTNSVTLTAGKWYPIRIWFSEHLGGCKAQIYAQGADGTKFNGSDLTFAHDIEG